MSRQGSIHQLLAGFSIGDAISNEALVLQRVFKSWDFASDVYADRAHTHPDLREKASPPEKLSAEVEASDIVVLHLSMGSAVNELFRNLKCHKVIIYHNITPAHFFDGIENKTARLLREGRAEIEALAGVADVNLAVSQFNADELSQMGYTNVQVLPLLLDLNALRTSPGPALLDHLSDGLVNVLFVGRCAPNKCIEDALSAFHYFQKYVEPNSRFIHIGSYQGMALYHALLLSQIRDLGLHNVEVLGSVKQEDLNAAYKAADLFLCMSEHEGFCIPVLEAMVHDTPVLAYNAGAIAETLAGSGVLFHEKNPGAIAEMMGRVTQDQALKKSIIARQRERLMAFEDLDLEGSLRRFLTPLIARDTRTVH